MSRIMSFSTDREFANELEGIISECGYRNRSRFLRDASRHFAESIRRGDISSMDDSTIVDGTLVIHYQHDAEMRLMHLRHQKGLNVHSFHHNCLADSHTCVDTILLRGKSGIIRQSIDQLNDTKGVDRVSFIIAPMRQTGCC